jgi:hypothetical protein
LPVVIALLEDVRRRLTAHSVRAPIQYVAGARERPQLYTLEPRRTVMSSVDRVVTIHDGRRASPPPALDREGFTLARHASRVRDFTDLGELDAVYRAEVRDVVAGLTAAPRVFIHPKMILRSNAHAPYDGAVLAEPTAPVVHCDFTAASIAAEARAAVEREGIAELPTGRVLALNVWRALSPPPQDMPLALCDLRTVRERDLVPSDSYGNRGSAAFHAEISLLQHHRRHRWCYFPSMANDEIIVFQQFDSGASGPSAVPHVSFRDPRARATSPRLSIEARAFVFFS